MAFTSLDTCVALHVAVGATGPPHNQLKDDGAHTGPGPTYHRLPWMPIRSSNCYPGKTPQGNDFNPILHTWFGE